MSTHQPILDTLDPEIVDTLVSRRQAITQGAKVGSAVTAALALGSIPVSIAALSSTAYAQAPAIVTQVLQFAFLLENLESEFYKAVLGTSTSAAFNDAFATVRGQLTTVDKATFAQISKHEVAHVALLKGALGSAAPTYTPANFDFTGGQGSGTGPIAPATQDRDFLLLATQVFEDTGVRAYKGQAGNLFSAPSVLTTALQIHSVEARHAARVRRMRRLTSTGVTDVVRYSGTIRGGGAAAAGAVGTPPQAVVDAANMIYGGATPESNTTHLGADATAVAANYGGAAATQEAFDEPLTAPEVVAIVSPFIVTGTMLPAFPST